MTRLELLQKVIDLGVESFRFDPVSVKEDTQLDRLGPDSLWVVELATEIESRLGCSFEPGEIASFSTIGDIVNILERKLAK
jgi:acyl carrier protein